MPLEGHRNSSIGHAKLVWLDSGHLVFDESVEQVAGEIKAAFAD